MQNHLYRKALDHPGRYSTVHTPHVRGSVYLDWNSQPNLRSFQELFPNCIWSDHYPSTKYTSTEYPCTYPSTDYLTNIVYQRRRKWRLLWYSKRGEILPRHTVL
ncbi:hypothetical protein PC129_g22903 [Phytophthora cactorum]|uniref:Uncharacterized protein n=1 Tax=Phytophthora cactorum TaxID=29920 RepID=A0A8T1H1M9_9STRA|nr:hypothetical protein PC129_g22903 [Phytophthora cactorum]